jgi:hypothetical protein
MGLQVYYHYYSILTVHVDPLVTLHIICSTPKHLPNVANHLHQAAPIPGHCLSLDAVLPSLQTITFKCFPSTITYYLLPSCGS